MNKLKTAASDFASLWRTRALAAGIGIIASAFAQANAEGATLESQWRLEFPTVAQTPIVTEVISLANGDWHVVNAHSRVALSSQLSVRATAPASYAEVRKSIVNGAEVVELASDLPAALFSGILQFENPAPITLSGPRQCSVQRFFADESLRWRQIIKGVRCTELSAADDGSVWLSAKQDLVNLRADGTVRHKIAYSDDNSPYQSILGISAARGINAGGAFITFKPKMAASANDFGVAYLDANGQQRWQYRPTQSGANFAVAPRLTSAKDGGVYIGGPALLRLDASGQLIVQLETGAQIIGEALTPDQGLIALTQANSQCALSKFSNTNSALWRTAVSCGLSSARDLAFPDPPIKVSASAILIVAKNHIGAFSSSGAQIFDRLQLYDIGPAALNTAGSEALFVSLVDSPYGQRLQRLQISTNQYAEVDLSAVERFSATPLNLQIGILQSNASSEGSVFLLGENLSDLNVRTLTAVNASGAKLWETQIATAGTNEAFFGASDSQACFLGDSADQENHHYRIRCFDARTGALKLDFTRNRVNAYGGVLLKSLSDRVLLLEGESAQGTEVFYSALSNGGQTIFKSRLPEFSYKWAFHNNGLLTLSGGTRFDASGQSISSDSLLSSWDLNGQLLWQKNYPFAASAVETLEVFRHGILLSLGEPLADGTRVPVFEWLDFSGQQIWRKPVDGGGYAQRISRFPGIGEAVFAEEARELSDSFYLLRAYYGNIAFPGLKSELQKFDLRNGAEIWHSDLNIDLRSNTDALLLPTNPINEKPLVVVRGKGKLGEQQFELLDSGTGASVGVQSISKELDFYPITNDIAGVFTTDRFNSSNFALQRQKWAAPSVMPILKPAHVGAWYNPAEPGQGFFSEQIGNTQFLAWFHNDWSAPDAGISDFLSPARQRWLTLQGDVLPGAASVALKIYDTGGGTFATGSAGVPKEVGGATLTFQGCDAATLNYEVRSQRCISSVCGPDEQFAMLHGSIPLQPLVSASACVATPAPSLVNAKTGLFHDPNVTGQGLIAVAGANTFFAGWFAADPNDAIDDPQKQVWFTLQADGATNSSHVVSTKIYRTLGGRRDNSAPAINQEVGTATLDYTSCDRLTVRYEFADAEFVAPFKGRSGTLNLERIGSCQR